MTAPSKEFLERLKKSREEHSMFTTHNPPRPSFDEDAFRREERLKLKTKLVDVIFNAKRDYLAPDESMNPPFPTYKGTMKKEPFVRIDSKSVGKFSTNNPPGIINHEYFQTKEAKANGDLATLDAINQMLSSIFLDEEIYYMQNECANLTNNFLEQLNIRRLFYLQFDPEEILKLPDATVQKTLQNRAKRAILCTDAWEKYNSLLRNYNAIRDQVPE